MLLRKSGNGAGPRARVAKVLGTDNEVAVWIQASGYATSTADLAVRPVLREIKGFPRASESTTECDCSYCRKRRAAEARSSARGEDEDNSGGYGYWGGIPGSTSSGYGGSYSTGYGSSYGSYSSSTGYTSHNAQDRGRRYLSGNGGCAYEDMSLLELCTPEILHPSTFVKQFHAMLRIARAALHRANARRPEDQQIAAVANNSDGQGHSWGSHMNFLVTRETWDDIFNRRVFPMLTRASFHASSIILTGQGKVGAENRAPRVDYQISGRADFFTCVTSLATTANRGMENCRDEALTGRLGYNFMSDRDKALFARVHDIFYDANLAHTALYLKAGINQIQLAHVEAGLDDGRLILDDPVEALQIFSHDPTLKARARLADGREVTAVELQQMFIEKFAPFVESGDCEETVPDAREIMRVYQETVELLARRDFERLIPKLDWVAKAYLIEDTLARRPDLSWDSPEIKHVDLLYANLDETQGLYWQLEKAGVMELLATDGEIDRAMDEPPEDTRAWTRAMLLRRLDAKSIDHVDWHKITVRCKNAQGYASRRDIRLDHPLKHTRAEAEALFETAQTQEELIEIFAEPEEPRRTTGSWQSSVYGIGTAITPLRSSGYED